MSDSYEITKQQLYLIIASSVFLSILLVILGILLGRNMQIPEGVTSIDELTKTYSEGQTIGQEQLDKIPKIAAKSSTQPYVPEEGMVFYDKLSGKKTAEPDASTKPESVESITTVDTFTTTEKVTIIPTPVPTIQTQVAPGEGYAVQISSLSVEDEANALVQQLKSKGFPAYVSLKKFKNNKLNYRVRIGPYATKAQAEEMAKKLEKTERRSTWVMNEKAEEKSE